MVEICFRKPPFLVAQLRLTVFKEVTLNNPEIYALEQGALMGIGTARSLARLFQDAIIDNKFFNNPATLRQFLTPFVNKPDIVTGAVVSRGNGLMFSPFQLGEV